jgi:uncharacterized Zn-binding protein involved in type VI secretion
VLILPKNIRSDKSLNTAVGHWFANMPPAATLISQTSHGTPFLPGPGSVNILIGGKSALRIGIDFHACPLSDGPKPHGGGVVAIGSKTVFFNNMPAVRLGDVIVEVGPPNAIISGVPTVIIGG